MATCSHLDTIRIIDVPSRIAGCEECLKIGGEWVHLRMCTGCGTIGCCDSSPHRHASGHFQETGHPVLRSAEKGERWLWCFIDEVRFEVAQAK